MLWHKNMMFLCNSAMHFKYSNIHIALKIVLPNKCQNKNNFVGIFLQIIVNLGKSSEVNKQYHVKSWKTYRNNNSV